jgi:hypothetical protein
MAARARKSAVRVVIKSRVRQPLQSDICMRNLGQDRSEPPGTRV